MRKGFKYDMVRCVDCRACVAACILENGWNYFPRNVYKSGSFSGNVFIINNLSLACNHCENPACLATCPAEAYYIDLASGAVEINDKKCLGCNYCKWNCPFDAPKTDPVEGLIGKCNLCLDALNEGLIPACTSACPTGALHFDKIPESDENYLPDWFPGKKLKPKIEFIEPKNARPLKIVPDDLFQPITDNRIRDVKSITKEWSLIAFTFLITWSVSLMASSFLSSGLPDKRHFFTILLLSGLASLFHLNKKLRAWRAITNVLKSPLSREIAAWIFYGLISTTAIFTEGPAMIVAASISGLVLLFMIDMVYTTADNRVNFIFNSGQSLLTGLLMISFFAGLKVPFIFIALIKAASCILNIILKQINLTVPGLRFFRLALLIITSICVVTGISYYDIALSFIFMTGELVDRVLYYYDFEPVTIKSVFNKQIS
jgi:Fe-S-cluster-containing dehydrogenase component